MSTGILVGDPYRKRRGRWLGRALFALGLLLALSAAALTYYVATAARTQAPLAAPTVDGLVATRDLPARAALAAGDVRVVKIPTDAAPDTLLHDPAAVAGQVTLAPIAKNEPVLSSKLVVAGSEGTHISVQPAGQIPTTGALFRAFSISVPDTNAAGGAVQAGDYVDILYTLNVNLVDPTKTDYLGRVVIENVPVLARTNTIYTLRVDVSTAERLAALQGAGGNLQLLLRAPGDERLVNSGGATFSGEAQRLLPKR